MNSKKWLRRMILVLMVFILTLTILLIATPYTKQILAVWVSGLFIWMLGTFYIIEGDDDK